MKLDTGCDIHNLIAKHIVEELLMSDFVKSYEDREAICTCLNGEDLQSIGTVMLRWKGKQFRKVFTTTFHVIDGDKLPWDVILGGETINEHGILRFAGFGGSSYILPKETKGMWLSNKRFAVTNLPTTEEKEKRAARKREQEKKAAENSAKVDATDKAQGKAQEKAQKSNSGDKRR